MWEFLSAWSQLYGLDCDQTFLGSLNASFRDANVNMRRAMGDLVDDVKRQKAKANANVGMLLKLTSGTASSNQGPEGNGVGPETRLMAL